MNDRSAYHTRSERNTTLSAPISIALLTEAVHKSGKKQSLFQINCQHIEINEISHRTCSRYIIINLINALHNVFYTHRATYRNCRQKYFKTLLRIWDCFLLEGPKVLFRFSLGVLYLQEEAILAKHDTVSIMRQLKAAAKLCFDVEGLISAAYEELEPFPKRDYLWRSRAAFHSVLLERAKKKERELNALRERERMMAQVELEGPHNHLIECAAVWGRDKIWICHGHHHGSRVSMIHLQENIMYPLRIEFESRVMCMHAPNDDTMLFGTYSRFVHAFHTISRKKMWEISLNACVLSLCSHQRDGVKQVFAGLADGTLAVVENVQGRLPKPEVFYVVIGTIPVTCLQLVGRRLWCACGPSVIILSARTLDLLDQFQTSSNGLDYIYRMVIGEQGVWITLRGSSILQLWDPHSLTCRLLYDVRDNYNARGTKVDETYTNHARITCVLPLESSAVVGTADGTLVFYDVVARKSPSPSAPSSPRPPINPESGHAKQIQERLQVSRCLKIFFRVSGVATGRTTSV
ncbi:hypothetical protein AVEN_34077-1 [Araneus ventricosus]|uniref:Uncharacterized protein n=1 Tax=Araneus ventricosus TaxID=182803 RepID=A0A4Y2P828_ARAVE|nr:hypothetical protein AVEN_34077-1 [Araneus ventricosus]